MAQRNGTGMFPHEVLHKPPGGLVPGLTDQVTCLRSSAGRQVPYRP
jgi:hypothetical protein